MSEIVTLKLLHLPTSKRVISLEGIYTSARQQMLRFLAQD
jgi:hypothetical protein